MGRRIAAVPHQAVLHVMRDQLNPCLTQSGSDGCDLGKNVNTVAILLDHASQPSGLSLNSGKAPDEFGLLFLGHSKIIPHGVSARMTSGLGANPTLPGQLASWH